jgi:hypothetical protein
MLAPPSLKDVLSNPAILLDREEWIKLLQEMAQK